MMTTVDLSSHDINVLEKIKDPESNPAAGVITDPTLPRDPNIFDDSVYERVVQKEREIIQTIQKLEIQLSKSMSEDAEASAVEHYKTSATDLDVLISEHPNYASARNNRAQIYRRLYGDAMLLSVTTGMPMPLIDQPQRDEKRKASTIALNDLERSISLLSPPSFNTPMSPQAARTLSMAHTQRAAIYLKTAKLMSHRSLDMDEERKESQWTKLDFEEAASRDLAYGGRYGNQIAKGLAVSVNPTAKLCGQIVREAMKKEYGPSFGE
jgi:hypothetical protein